MSSGAPSTSTSQSPGPSSETASKDISSTFSPKDTEENTHPAQESEEPSEMNIQGGTPSTATPTPDTSSSPWQAIYSPQYNAYYFFNSVTNETTWENPLVEPAADGTNLVDPAASSSATSSSTEESSPSTASPTSYNALQAAAVAQGIDPSLAHLDPSLAGPVPGSSSSFYGASAKFNARTGQFTRTDARDPSHLSEYERAKRMSEFYFDVGAWENQRAQDQEEEAAGENEKKRKRPSKKDLVNIFVAFDLPALLRIVIR
ncbi:hypothetical protein D9757_010955 [Collybiopsis confluens]|uniref:WW domain-containing protein n=1 Tax=Collybiopsis confluens TaxID=2823264 RepID=A0A8H5GJY8_9AGAR|nr:hypothetical protein D9757_010955 [Collybiopsis confluens]